MWIISLRNLWLLFLHRSHAMILIAGISRILWFAAVLGKLIPEEKVVLGPWYDARSNFEYWSQTSWGPGWMGWIWLWTLERFSDDFFLTSSIRDLLHVEHVGILHELCMSFCFWRGSELLSFPRLLWYPWSVLRIVFSEYHLNICALLDSWSQ